MSVNLRRFVNLNVSRTKRNAVNPVRDTVALYGLDAIPGTDEKDIIFVSGAVTSRLVSGETIHDYVLTTVDGDKITIQNIDVTANQTLFYKYARTYFDNGGVKLHAYVGSGVIASEASPQAKVLWGNAAEGEFTVIPLEEIALIRAKNAETLTDVLGDATVNDVKNVDGLANSMTSYAKIFISHITDETAAITVKEKVAAKLGVSGIEMTIAAYLSQINAYGENTVHDYAFTIEDIALDKESNISDDDATIGECMQKFINVDSTLAKAIRNVGGDLIDGNDIVNEYMTIVLQQTCEEAVMNALSSKLAGAEGTAVIYNTLVTELNKYVRCGLLAAGNWEDVDWNVEFEDENYVVVNADERLVLGYKVLVIPFAAMSQEQVASHACPPIYVAMTNAYGIRKVVINGEVR